MSIVAFDKGVFQTMQSVLGRAGEEESIPVMPHPRPRRATAATVRPKLVPQEVIFHINAKSDSDVQAVKLEIQRLVKESYLEKEEDHNCLEFIDDSDYAKILQCSSDEAIVDLGELCRNHTKSLLVIILSNYFSNTRPPHPLSIYFFPHFFKNMV